MVVTVAAVSSSQSGSSSSSCSGVNRSTDTVASSTSNWQPLEARSAGVCRCQFARLLTLLCRLFRGMFGTSDLAGTHCTQDSCLAETKQKLVRFLT